MRYISDQNRSAETNRRSPSLKITTHHQRRSDSYLCHLASNQKEFNLFLSSSTGFSHCDRLHSSRGNQNDRRRTQKSINLKSTEPSSEVALSRNHHWSSLLNPQRCVRNLIFVPQIAQDLFDSDIKSFSLMRTLSIRSSTALPSACRQSDRRSGSSSKPGMRSLL
jgi:hypothetical protein